MTTPAIDLVSGVLASVTAVLFDMDGVLIDGMPLHAQAWEMAFHSIGLQIEASEVYEREGENGLAAAELFLRRRNLHPTSEQVRDVLSRKEEAFRRVAQFKPFPGAVDLLHQLKQRNRKLAIVTGTARAELLRSLPASMTDVMDAIITGDDVERGKPHPEPYRKALDHLELSPSEALVIENAPLGIQSARAAGVRCLAVATTLPCSRLVGADRCFPHLAALSEFLLHSGA